MNDYPWPGGRPPIGPGCRIGGDGPVVAAWDAAGWRLVVRGAITAAGIVLADLHDALRDLATSDGDLARDAFGVVMNCALAWEDDYTELNGEDSLTFDDWIRLVQDGGDVWVDDDGAIHSDL